MPFRTNSDRDRFVHEATQRLYSSLQVDEALHATLRFLKQYMPAESFHAGIFHPPSGTLRYLASAKEERAELIDERLQLSPKAVGESTLYRIGEARIDNQPDQTRVVGEIGRHFRSVCAAFPNFALPDLFSTLTMTVGVGAPYFGFFNIVADGADQFTEEHRHLFTLLERPLTGAALNLWHYREMLCENERLVRSNALLRSRLGHLSPNQIVGAETGLHEVVTRAGQVAATTTPVLITGETGTGKEVVAHLIHRQSGRDHQPMVCVNCGAIPETLMDSELFGHEKGAFTGATEKKRGFFEQADEGTIFLDEVGELSMAAQVKLLRVLQDRTIRRVGGALSISVDVRVIAATHRNLSAMVAKGLFREDLWFRLHVFPIPIPPLRERKTDIPALAETFVARKAREMNLPFSPDFAPGALEDLKHYNWPGNIRELQNRIERSLITCDGNPLTFPDIRDHTETVVVEEGKGETFPRLDTIIIRHIQAALHRTDGRIEGPAGAAQLLGLHPSTLRGKMRKYGIRYQDF